MSSLFPRIGFEGWFWAFREDSVCLVEGVSFEDHF